MIQCRYTLYIVLMFVNIEVNVTEFKLLAKWLEYASF